MRYVGIICGLALLLIMGVWAAAPTPPTTRPQTPEIVWTQNFGKRLKAAPVMTPAGLILPTDAGQVHLLDPATGKPIWSAPVEGSAGQATCTEKLVYLGDEDGFMRCLDLATGKERWQFATQQTIVGAPLLADGRIYFGSYNHKVYALDADTGKELWSFTTDAEVHAPPRLVDNMLLVGGCDGFVRWLDPATGKEVQQYKLGQNVASAPLIDTSVKPPLVVVAGMTGQVAALTAADKVLWQFDLKKKIQADLIALPDAVGLYTLDGLFMALNRDTGKTLARFQLHDGERCAPLLTADTIYLLGDSRLYALDSKTYKKRWDFKLTGQPVATPALSADALYIAQENGTLIKLRLP
ncbi:MAG: PQQ-binding-like beta-propeller repeat protein [Phycisphaerae bacterium]